jgi:hypothetical protein
MGIIAAPQIHRATGAAAIAPIFQTRIFAAAKESSPATPIVAVAGTQQA